MSGKGTWLSTFIVIPSMLQVVSLLLLHSHIVSHKIEYSRMSQGGKLAWAPGRKNSNAGVWEKILLRGVTIKTCQDVICGTAAAVLISVFVFQVIGFNILSGVHSCATIISNL